MRHPRVDVTRAAATAFLFVTLLACAAPSREEPGQATDGPPSAWQRILDLEDARRDDAGELRAFLRDATPRLRARAALALARFEFEDLGAPVTEALVGALDDPDPRVREHAAFGLGLRGDATAAMAILAHWQDVDPDVRAALAEAATRLGERSLVPHVLRALEDPNPVVRAAAADGCQRWPWLEREATPEDDRTLARAIDVAVALRAAAPVEVDGEPLIGFTEPLAGGPREPEELEVVWRALATLARRSAPAGTALFVRWSVAEPLEARLFATQGLARLAARDDVALEPGDASSAEVAVVVAEGLGLESASDVHAALAAHLAHLSADTDDRVAVEAVRGLGALAARHSASDEWSGTVTTALGAALGHPSVHVRAVAWESLGTFADVAPVSHLLRRVEDEDAPPARAAAVMALARLRGERALRDVEQLATSQSPVERAGAAAAAAELPRAVAIPLILALADDRHPKVAGAALTALSSFPEDEAGRLELRSALEARDSALRLAAALALREHATAEDVPYLQLAALTSRGDAGPEARFEAARTLAALEDGGAARTLERMAREDEDPYVRRVVRGLLAAQGRPLEELDSAHMTPGEHDVTSTSRTTAPPNVPSTVTPWRGAAPRVTFVTNRGELEFELLPTEAPHHVANVIALARSGAYDGTSWHRVVPDFVIQGGDARGDGNGGGTWRGPDDSLRLEVTRRRYRTGSLGMPRNEDRDSGGRQIFVTHRPTPHLDGRYTIFGELVRGFDVLAAIQEGDTILTARVD